MGFIWGIPYLFIKIAVGELSPASLVFLRTAIGTVVLLVALGYASGATIISRKLSTLPSLGVVAASLAITALVYGPVGIAQLPPTLPSPAVVFAVAVLGIVCTALAFVLFFALIAEA